MSVVSRLVFLAYFAEVGLLLLIVPWSPFWDRNYFLQVWRVVRWYGEAHFRAVKAHFPGHAGVS